ncbi:MAG: hypothetical protein JEZ14_00990 [Marinilabiliaceae bacterium]|nr:hypothetical protein [Marinilabiliaceae bacterium]
MRIVFYLLILSVLVFIGCNNSNHPVVYSFVRKNVQREIIDLDYQLLNVQDVFICSDNIVFFDNKSDTLFYCLDLVDFKCIKRFGVIGKGPNEFIYPVIDAMGSFNDSIYVTDKYKVKYLNYEGMLHDEYSILPFKLMPVNNLKILNDSTYMVSSISQKDSNRSLFLVNSKKRSFEEYGRLPEIMNPVMSSDSYNSEILTNNITVNQKTNQVAVLYSYLPVLQVYSGEKVNEKTLYSYEKQVLLNFYGKRKDYNSIYSYYTDIDSNERYIIGLYIGRKIGELKKMRETDIMCYLHVWDWDGNPLCEIPINSAISHIVIDENDNVYMVNPFIAENLYKLSLSNLN